MLHQLRCYYTRVVRRLSRLGRSATTTHSAGDGEKRHNIQGITSSSSRRFSIDAQEQAGADQ
jgi:hypothetical protein